jgi:methionine synthase II (cobalamin-independent)
MKSLLFTFLREDLIMPLVVVGRYKGNSFIWNEWKPSSVVLTFKIRVSCSELLAHNTDFQICTHIVNYVKYKEYIGQDHIDQWKYAESTWAGEKTIRGINHTIAVYILRYKSMSNIWREFGFKGKENGVVLGVFRLIRRRSCHADKLHEFC